MKKAFTNSVPASALAGFKPQRFRARTFQGHYLETGEGGINSTWCDTASAARLLTEAQVDDLIRRGIADEKVPA